jgi:hypothetical protein
VLTTSFAWKVGGRPLCLLLVLAYYDDHIFLQRSRPSAVCRLPSPSLRTASTILRRIPKLPRRDRNVGKWKRIFTSVSYNACPLLASLSVGCVFASHLQTERRFVALAFLRPFSTGARSPVGRIRLINGRSVVQSYPCAILFDDNQSHKQIATDRANCCSTEREERVCSEFPASGLQAIALLQSCAGSAVVIMRARAPGRKCTVKMTAQSRWRAPAVLWAFCATHMVFHAL